MSEPDVAVCRSKLEPDIWFCYGDASEDKADFEFPGHVLSVKMYAANKYAPGRQVRWEREDPDTWRLRIVHPAPTTIERWAASDARCGP